MGVGKILKYTIGGFFVGVGAVALAPLTGGGSVFGAAALVSSGTFAMSAGVIGGGTGAYLARKEEDEDEDIHKKIVELTKKAEKFEEDFKKALKQFHGDKEYFNYIIGTTALGIAMATVDADICLEEREEIEEFIGGIASYNYPLHIKETLQNLYSSKIDFHTAMTYLEKIHPSNYSNIRNLLEIIVEVDGIRHEKEEKFLNAFDAEITMIEYKPEREDVQNNFLAEVQSKF